MHLWCGPPAERAGERPDGGGLRNLTSQGGDQNSPEPKALKIGFRETQTGFRPSPLPSPSQTGERPPLAISAPLSLCALAPPRRQPQPSIFLKRSPSFPFLFARLALKLGPAKAIPPRPKRRTKLRPDSSYSLSTTSDNPFKRDL
jgi:hypothetical protein